MSVMWHGNLISFVAPEIKIIISQNKYSRVIALLDFHPLVKWNLFHYILGAFIFFFAMLTFLLIGFGN